MSFDLSALSGAAGAAANPYGAALSAASGLLNSPDTGSATSGTGEQNTRNTITVAPTAVNFGELLKQFQVPDANGGNDVRLPSAAPRTLTGATSNINAGISSGPAGSNLTPILLAGGVVLVGALVFFGGGNA